MKTYIAQSQFLTILNGVQNAIPRQRLAVTAGVSLAVLDAVVRYIHILWHIENMEEAQDSEVVRAAKQRIMALCTTEPDDNWYAQIAFVSPQTKEVAMILNRQPTPKQEAKQEESHENQRQQSVSDKRDSIHFEKEDDQKDDQDEEPRTSKKDKRKTKRY